MKERRVDMGRRARIDVERISHQIAHFSGPLTAERYTQRMSDAVTRLDIATERGLDRSDISPGLRVIAFEKSAVFAVKVYRDRAVVIRIFNHGQDWESALRRQFHREAPNT